MKEGVGGDGVEEAETCEAHNIGIEEEEVVDPDALFFCALVLRGHRGGVRCCAFARPDGEILIYCSFRNDRMTEYSTKCIYFIQPKLRVSSRREVTTPPCGSGACRTAPQSGRCGCTPPRCGASPSTPPRRSSPRGAATPRCTCGTLKSRRQSVSYILLFTLSV